MLESGEPQLGADDVEVLRRLAAGRSGVQVAGDADGALDALTARLQRIRHHLGVSSTAAALETARRRGLLPSGDEQ